MGFCICKTLLAAGDGDEAMELYRVNAAKYIYEN